MGLGRKSEYVLERREATLELASRPFWACVRDEVLPAHVIVAVQADFEPGAMHFTHLSAAMAPDIRPRQQYAIQQRFEPVVLQYRGSRHLLGEPGPENAAHCAAGVIGPHGKIKGRVDSEALE